ncbi:hypothetical protein [Rathayibacter sp. AY1D1]|uniref:hypothetical protein n=1 Tax=Rathayibacter sp. AY1D1 TaxID=2080542 RepID=UPI0011B03AF4|nr:hypothetical protein [Rathayibacter sp. AY1D1]
MHMLSERARVLITVKASPEPSKTYGDTVCVAGVRLNEDGTGSWVRIYPVAFRHLDSAQQFKKFEVIEVDLTRSSKDARTESYRPNWETLSRSVDWSGKYKTHDPAARGPVLEKLVGPTMCELRAGVEADLNAQSLGLIEVRELRKLRFVEHGPWTKAQVASMQTVMGQPDIFGEVDDTPMLIPPRFKVHYDYYCMSPMCGGHKPRILDIELSALQHKNRFKSNEELKDIITRKFHAEMWNDAVRTYFFVGNFGDIVKRKNFSVLGVYRPRRATDYATTLF